jgi:hypothetical protein
MNYRTLAFSGGTVLRGARIIGIPFIEDRHNGSVALSGPLNSETFMDYDDILFIKSR